MQFRQPFQGDYPITLDYGEKFPPLYTDESPHRGIDYGCPMSTPILASADGTVTEVKQLKQGYGNYITIKHKENYSTLYAHLSELLVRENQTVTKGQVIGRSGSTGNSTGPHLHFEVRKNNIQIDPKPLMQNVVDLDNDSVNSQFETVHSGYVKVVCSVANVRCHCDMNRVITQKNYGDTMMITDVVTMWNGIPYRDYYDASVGCWLRIAEHDPYTQIISNE